MLNTEARTILNGRNASLSWHASRMREVEQFERVNRMLALRPRQRGMEIRIRPV